MHRKGVNISFILTYKSRCNWQAKLKTAIPVITRRGQWWTDSCLNPCWGLSTDVILLPQDTLTRSLLQSQTCETKPDKEAKLWPFVDKRLWDAAGIYLVRYHRFSNREALPCRQIRKGRHRGVETTLCLAPYLVLKPRSKLCESVGVTAPRDNGIRWALHRDSVHWSIFNTVYPRAEFQRGIGCLHCSVQVGQGKGGWEDIHFAAGAAGTGPPRGSTGKSSFKCLSKIIWQRMFYNGTVQAPGQRRSRKYPAEIWK